MARIWNDGAEFGDLLFWDVYVGTTNAANKRSGSYSYLTGTNGYFTKYITAISEFYIRFGFYTGGNAGRLEWYSGGTRLGHIVWGGSLFSLYINDVFVVSGTATVLQDMWHLVEVHVKIADSGNVDTKINGVTDITYSGDTKPGAATTVDRLRFGTVTGIYIDDLALNDTAGGVDDSWCGDGHIEALTPNDNGDVNNWTGSDGDKVNNYLLVDDIPASGDDYNKSSTALEQQMYKVTDFTGTGKIINRVWAECRAKDNAVAGGQIKIGIKSGATVDLSASARTLSGNYARVVGDDETINPDDSGAWEDADLDAIQFVAECE